MEIKNAWEIVRDSVDVAYNPSIFYAIDVMEKYFDQSNTISLKCPLYEAGKMCRLFNDKPYKCDGTSCKISGMIKIK